MSYIFFVWYFHYHLKIACYDVCLRVSNSWIVPWIWCVAYLRNSVRETLSISSISLLDYVMTFWASFPNHSLSRTWSIEPHLPVPENHRIFGRLICIFVCFYGGLITVQFNHLRFTVVSVHTHWWEVFCCSKLPSTGFSAPNFVCDVIWWFGVGEGWGHL